MPLSREADAARKRAERARDRAVRAGTPGPTAAAVEAWIGTAVPDDCGRCAVWATVIRRAGSIADGCTSAMTITHAARTITSLMGEVTACDHEADPLAAITTRREARRAEDALIRHLTRLAAPDEDEDEDEVPVLAPVVDHTIADDHAVIEVGEDGVICAECGGPTLGPRRCGHHEV